MAEMSRMSPDLAYAFEKQTLAATLRKGVNITKVVQGALLAARGKAYHSML